VLLCSYDLIYIVANERGPLLTLKHQDLCVCVATAYYKNKTDTRNPLFKSKYEPPLITYEMCTSLFQLCGTTRVIDQKTISKSIRKIKICLVYMTLIFSCKGSLQVLKMIHHFQLPSSLGIHVEHINAGIPLLKRQWCRDDISITTIISSSQQLHE
jgi:hypothetical protein